MGVVADYHLVWFTLFAAGEQLLWQYYYVVRTVCPSGGPEVWSCRKNNTKLSEQHNDVITALLRPGLEQKIFTLIAELAADCDAGERSNCEHWQRIAPSFFTLYKRVVVSARERGENKNCCECWRWLDVAGRSSATRAGGRQAAL